MHDKEAIEMMQRCASEITDLRRQIEVLAPKADAYDNLATVLNLLPKRSQGMGLDLVWDLKKRIEELERAEVNPARKQDDETEGK